MATAKTQTMPRPLTLSDRYLRLRSQCYRWKRLLRPSAAEIKFIRLMGGSVLVLPGGLAIVRLGWFLKSELVEREVRVGKCYVDFAIAAGGRKRAIEIDGARYHTDIIREQKRDEYLQERGFEVLHIMAWKLWREPRRAYVRAFKFIKS